MTRRPVAVAIAALACAAAPAWAAPVVLDVPLVAQEHDQWCWAGATRAALLHYGVDQAQCAIAEYTRQTTDAVDVDLGPVDCCVDWTQGCNGWNYFWTFRGSIADILFHFGALENATFERPLAVEEVAAAIDAGRLLVVRWAWNNGGGHFVVAHGYDGASVYYMNPWPGEGLKIADYAWMSSGDTHTWAASLTTGPVCPYEGAACNDHDPCTDSDVCHGAVCSGTAVVCPQPACGVSACVPASGLCTTTSILDDGTSCDDGDPCTVDDACVRGACGGTAKVCAATECRGAGWCAATTGECDGAPVEDGTDCAGGTCQAGQCEALPELSCSTAPGGPGLWFALLAQLAALALRRRNRG